MLYPLRFQPICQERIWGGTGLRDEFGRQLPTDKIGESWEITCRAEAESRVASGPLKGRALGELCNIFGAALLGEKIAVGNSFPLLLKILDAQDILSVQVHPDDQFAAVHEGAAGKSEVWYILKAQPGAKIIYGLRPGITQQDFIAALKRGQLTACLHQVAVKAGEIYPIPPGLVHALGKGIMVVELQQNSDLTYRVFDWNRVDQHGKARPLHVEKALQVIEFGLVPPGPFHPDGNGLLLENEHFSLAYHRVTTEKIMTQSPAAFTLLTVVAGTGEIWHQGQGYSLQYGDSYLLPASLGQYVLRGEMELLFGSPNKPLHLAKAGQRDAVFG
ncbi:MAG TPA: class I mannose-6-phosphate isomerase [Firmicutes bacterium]|nr:class I mannose-6-phosphate isomerase [Bacillota bacterium]